ncbi:MAG: large conductance mechanosensitive channel protein MscL [Clostridia bacterium]|nr:large conductance mechanosensitive channel protein MscL [Clostridia bacterium]
MKGFMKEFKAFIMRGNVLDMAVGVVIGGAFTAIVTSIVENLLTPIIGLCLKDSTFAEWAPGGFGVGAVINAIITFLITAFVLFCIVKAVNKMSKKKEEEPAPDPEPSEEVLLLREIRDLLEKK